MSSFSLATSPPRSNLHRLLMVRGLFLLVVCATLAFCYWQLALPLAYHAMLWVISGLTLINIATLVQLRFFPKVSEYAFFTQLLIDIIGVSLLLFFGGGADNPFVSYYLVPLCIAAATLSWRLTWPLLIASLLLYTSLFFYRIPLPDIAPSHHHGGQAINDALSFHTVGMWFNFLLSALLITFFVIKMAASLRQRDADLAQLREDRLRDEQLLAVASLAAGTAHELGTPLTTIKALLKEMESDYREVPALSEDLQLLQNQVSHCADSLKRLTGRAAQLKDGILPLETAFDFCQQVIDEWLLLRPEVEAKITLEETTQQCRSHFHPTLSQSLSNLLNNAADANPKGIVVHAHCSSENLVFSIRDHGPGIEPDRLKDLGQAFVSNKGQGRGLGLFLTRAALDRHGGKLDMQNHPQGGVQTTLHLPLNSPKETS